MTRWQALQNWIHVTGASSFSSGELAASAGISPAEASDWIRAYQRAQVCTSVPTAYVIRRVGRASASVWKVGVTAVDVREVSKQFANDVGRRVDRVIVPVIDAIADANPNARKQAISTGVQIGRLVEQLAQL